MTEKGACGIVDNLASPLFIRMIDRLLPFAQFFIKFQPQTAQVFNNPARFTHALHMYIQLLRRDVEPDAIGRLLQETLQTRQREDVFDMGVVESKHQLRGKRPHPVVHDDWIVAVELQTVIDVVKRVIEIDHCLRLALRHVYTGVRTMCDVRSCVLFCFYANITHHYISKSGSTVRERKPQWFCAYDLVPYYPRAYRNLVFIL